MTRPSPHPERAVAHRPEDLNRLFAERLNTRDLDGLVALFEPDAALALPGGDVARGTDAVRAALGRFLSSLPEDAPPRDPEQGLRPALVNGDLAMTSRRSSSTATAEVARRQGDGTWLWVLDRPDALA